jgi:predicted N-acyltransferase
MAEIRVLRSILEFEQRNWDALVRPGDSPFVEWTWLATLEEAGCVRPEVGWLPCHLTLYENDQLLGAAPAYLKGNSEGEFVFDWRFAEVAAKCSVEYYPKLIVAVPFTPATGARFLVAPTLPPGFDREKVIELLGAGALELARQASASSVHALFTREADTAQLVKLGYHDRHGVQFHWHRRDATTFEEFLARLPSKKRTQLRRERKELAAQGIEIRTLEGDDYTPAIARTMFRFYRSTVDKFVWGRQYLNPRFFDLIAQRFRDRLAWVVASRNGKPIAGAFNVRGSDTLYGRYWGADEEVPFLHFNVCYYHGIEDCLRWSLDTFEPGAGGEHKHARGFDETITRSAHVFFNPRLRAIIENYFDEERSAIAKALART